MPRRSLPGLLPARVRRPRRQGRDPRRPRQLGPCRAAPGQERRVPPRHAGQGRQNARRRSAAKKIGAWYGACMNESAIEKAGATPLQPLLDDIDKVKDAKGLYAAVASAPQARIFPFFDVGSQQDFKDATQVIAALDQGGLGLPNREYYLDDDAHTKEIRAFYQGTSSACSPSLGAKPDTPRRPPPTCSASRPRSRRSRRTRSTAAIPTRSTTGSIARASPSRGKRFPWDDYWKGLGFAEIKDISVNSVPYFTRLDELLKKEKADALRNYLTRVVIHSQANRLSSAFVDERFALKQKLSGQKELEPRWRRCVASTDDAVGELLAQPYVAAKFDGDSKREAKALIQGDPRRDAHRARRPAVDGRAHPRRRRGQADADERQDRLPRALEDATTSRSAPTYTANVLASRRLRARGASSRRSASRSTATSGR